MSSPIALRSLLSRIQSKIESRTRRAWFDLQRTFYFKNKAGVKSLEELKIALEHFHVSLSKSEMELLYSSYPGEGGSGFDFRTFAAALYPRDAEEQSVLIAKDGLAERRERLEKQEKEAKPSNESAAASAPAAAVSSSDEDFVLVNHSDAPSVESSAAPAKSKSTKRVTIKRNTGKQGNTARLTFGTRSPVLSSSLKNPAVLSYTPVKPSPYPAQEFIGHGKYSSTAVNPRFSLKHY